MMFDEGKGNGNIKIGGGSRHVVVPEPTSAMLLLLGGLALSLAPRRRCG